MPGPELVGLPHVEHGNTLVGPYRVVYRLGIRLLRLGLCLRDQLIVALRHCFLLPLAPSFRGQMLAAAGAGYAFLFCVETVTVPSGRSPIS
jgi:hypothetical protein